ncbi:MAG: glycosyltransferase [Gemmatimonadota bacterium]|nr:glycosyltransferase [Gemmatimonadota bacterium]
MILSANPIHDTGGGQRSAQLALELLDRDFRVLFVSHGKVTETVDLGMRFDHPLLTSVALTSLSGARGRAALDPYLRSAGSVVITQVPVRTWEPVLAQARAAGAVTIYDCIDRWDSELGRGWYRAEAELRIAEASRILVASAPELVQHVELLAGRVAHLLPNAYNSRVFGTDSGAERPSDMPRAPRIALYVGALWGGWLDWDLVGKAARALPETRFVFVGDHRREGRGLPDNCVFLGLKPHQALPGYLAHADLAFLPWTADEVTQATSPLKVYEFVAMGLPVVGPSIDTLSGIPGVRRFADASDFVQAIQETERASLSDEIRREMADFADRNSWVQRVDALLGLAADTATPNGTAGRTKRAMISVVIPAYNHERWVRQAVESVRTQSLPAGELVVVDDGSTDGTPDILDQLRFPGMRVITQENRGAHVAINRAVALSTGDYIAILNSDDEFTETRLEQAWGVARATRAGLVIGSVSLIDASGNPLSADHDSSRWYREARGEPSRSRSLARALLRHNFAVTTSNFFFHRELWRRLGGFSAYRYVHDYDFVLRALELSADRVVYAEALEGVRYRVHGHNTILEDTGRAMDERAVMLKTIRSPARRLGHVFTRAGGGAAVRRAIDATDELTPVTGPTVDTRNFRLGLVAPALDHGGLEEMVALLAQTLPALGVEPHVLCTHSGGAVADRLSAGGVDVTVGHGRAPEWRKWAEQVAPQALSTHFVDLEVVETFAGLGLPMYETVQNAYAWFRTADWSREARKCALLTGTVAVSDVVADYYARFTGTEPTRHRIPNGVHPGRAASVPRAWAREQLGLSSDAPVLVHLGRVTLQKNVLGLLRAFEIVLEQEPSACLILAGSMSDRSYVRKVRGRHGALLRRGAVRLVPPVSHVGTVLSAADAYVSNSFFEGWSIAASEAAWNGLPLVLSDCGSARQLVGDQDQRGRVVPNPLGDPLDVTMERLEEPRSDVLEANEKALAGALVEVLAAREVWFGRREAIVRYARAEVSPERVGGAYAGLFSSAVSP